MSIITPPPYGRPDYSAPYPNLSQLVTYINEQITDQYLSPIVPTAPWQSVEVIWVPSEVPSFLDVQWWDNGETENLITDTLMYSADGNQVLGPYTFPNAGPYLEVKLEHIDQGSPGRFEQLWVYLSGRTPNYPSAYQTDNVVTYPSDTVAAGGSFIARPNNAWVGPAKLYLTSTEAVTWQLQVANLDGMGVAIDGSIAAATVFSVPIICPMSQWQITINNGSGSDATFTLYVTPSATGAT